MTEQVRTQDIEDSSVPTPPIDRPLSFGMWALSSDFSRMLGVPSVTVNFTLEDVRRQLPPRDVADRMLELYYTVRRSFRARSRFV